MNVLLTSTNVTSESGSEGNAAAAIFLAKLVKEIVADASTREMVDYVILNVKDLLAGGVSGDLTLAAKKSSLCVKPIYFTEGHFEINDRWFSLENVNNILEIIHPPSGW